MGQDGVAERTQQLKLYAWEDNADLYNHTQLYANWISIDTALLKKKWGATADYAYGDYAEQIRFAGSAGLGTPVISVRVGTATTSGGTITLSTADANDRFNILTGGTVNWGDGTAATDVALYRSGANTLSLSGTLSLNSISLSNSAGKFSQVTSAGSSSVFLEGQISGDTYNRYNIVAGGTVNWGSGTAATDTKLYRSGAGTLAIDNVLAVNQITPPSGTLTITNNVKFNGSSIGFFGSATSQSTGWGAGPSNVESGTKTYDANTATLNQIADTLGNLIITLRSYGILGA